MTRRKAAPKARLKKLKNLNVKIKMLTGDQKGVSASIGKRLGMNANNIITGAEFDLLSENDAAKTAESVDIFSELSPSQKSEIIKTLQQNGHTVGFLGDGLNDLPAIICADAGICVDTAAEAVNESADAVLMKKDLNVLEAGIIEGRKAFSNMSKYIKITASSNFGNICSIVIAGIFLPFFPMTSVQLLFLNLLYDALCLVLPLDNIDNEMYSKPREWSGKSLGKFMMFFGPVSSVFDIITFIFLFFFLCPAICGGSFQDLGAEARINFTALFQTGWFLESMWTQILILHLLRTKKFRFCKAGRQFPLLPLPPWE
ncbi:MAG: HAD-IC family P-type ATPase [Clostridiales bacterium]|nr:HAD-IC family P-type ATPase [Clostridiales bacterium]